MKVVVKAVAVLFGLIHLSFAQNPPSNVQFLERELSAGLDSLEYFRMPDTSTMSIELDGLNSDHYAFLNSFFIRYLKNRGFKVQLDSADIRIRIKRFSTKFRYHESPTRLIGFNQKIKRDLKFELTGWIEADPARRIIQTIELKHKVHDSIPADVVNEMEDGPYNLGKGVWETRSMWTQYLEPAVVIISVSTMIYLFFSMRSS